MAISIIGAPLAINPVYRSINFRTSSNSGTIAGIRGDLYINGTYSSTIDGIQELGTTDTFNFDIRKIMQSQLVHELRTNITSFAVTSAITSAAAIKIRFYEVLLTSGVLTTTWAAAGAGTSYLESSTYDCVNMAQQPLETLTDYTVDDPTKLLLTTGGDNAKIPRGIPFQIGFIGEDINWVANIIERDINLTSISNTSTSILSALTYSKGVIEIPASAFSNVNTAFIDIKLLKPAVADRSITHRFKVVDYCDNFTLFWENHFGAFDHYDFSTKVIENVNTKNQTMEKPLLNGFSSEDSGLITIESQATTKIRVQTGSLSQVDLTKLKDLIRNHSVVYKWNAAGQFLRYIIKSHSTKVSDNDALINNLSFVLQPSNDHITQKGS